MTIASEYQIELCAAGVILAANILAMVNQTTPTKTGTGYILDAIDIDSTSDLKPPQDLKGHGLLWITMSDSSEREYRLSIAEIDNFIKWYDRTVCTENTCYVFDKAVQNSKEHLSFEKIISFEVIPLTE